MVRVMVRKVRDPGFESQPYAYIFHSLQCAFSWSEHGCTEVTKVFFFFFFFFFGNSTFRKRDERGVAEAKHVESNDPRRIEQDVSTCI